jgi:hypothetical protein
MLIMGLYSQYISKITSNSTSLCTFLQPKKTMHFKRFTRSKLIKHYIILTKEVLYAWKYPKVNPTIITKESYGTKA